MNAIKIIVVTLLVLFVAVAAVSAIEVDERKDGQMFTGNEDHTITLAEANAYMERFRQQEGIDVKLGGTFGSEAVLRILSQEECVGLKYYYGLDEDNKKVLVLFGVDKYGNDLTEGEIAERSYPCPPFCPDVSL